MKEVVDSTLKNNAYDSEQVKIGIKVEKEHTDDEKEAEKIAKDHLREHPKYYTYLLKMEKKLNKE